MDLDGDLFNIVQYQHHKPGKGAAVVRTKLKNVKTGAVLDKTFRADEKVELARLDKREMQYLYSDENGYIFMDTESYEQTTVAKDFVGDAADFMKENQMVGITFYQSSPIGIELPTAVDLEITHTDPGLQGDRSSAGTKPATLETGAVVNVPLFLTTGEVIRVDTRTRQYVTRVR